MTFTSTALMPVPEFETAAATLPLGLASTNVDPENELRQAAALYRAVFESSLDAVVLSTPGGVIQAANAAACSVFGRTEDELCRLTRAELVDPTDSRLHGLLAERERKGEARGQMRFVRANGKAFEAIASSRLIVDAIGRQHALLIIRDLTAHRQTQAALAESETRFCALIEAVPEAILVETAGRIAYANTAALTLFGAEAPGSLLGTPVLARFPAGEAANLPSTLADLQRDPRTPNRRALICRRLDESGVEVEFTAVPVNCATEPGSLITLRDLTGQRLAEEKLQLHHAALVAAANAIVITDATGRIEWANPAFTTLSGWSLEEAVGRNPRELLKSGHQSTAFYREMWATLSSGEVWRGEIVNRRKDGHLRTEEMTITPLRDAAGKVGHFIAIKQDITEQKATQHRLVQAQRMEAIGTLAGGIAHDLNNILAPILLVGGTLQQRAASPVDAQLIAMIHASARRGADVIRQLLTFSRGQKGERALLQVRHLLKEMVAMMHETFPREIEIATRLPNALWPAEADAAQLHQVFLNLAVNARDAMPQGGRLTISGANVTLAANNPLLPAGASPGPFLRIDIVDTGVGIAPEIRERIFDPFFTTKDVGRGTGLGLATALGIVRSHGGGIHVESTAGRGSTFTVLLPAVPGEEAAPPEAAVAAPPPMARRATLLVVDDEPSIRESTQLVLATQGFNVLTAGNGVEALTLYLSHRHEITAVLTDLMMPVMNGVVLVRALRALDPGVRVVGTTGVIEPSRQAEIAGLHLDQLVMKPADAPTLLTAVFGALSRRAP